MSESSDPTCPSCGAPVAADATKCKLCGIPLGPDEPPSEAPDASSDVSPADGAAAEPSSESEEEVFCHGCGWKNPAHARFCSQCGAKLQELPEGTRPVAADLPRGDSETSSSNPQPAEPAAAVDAPADTKDGGLGVGTTVAWIVGGALIAIVGLFLIDVASDRMDWGSDEVPAAEAPSAEAPGGGEAPQDGDVPGPGDAPSADAPSGAGEEAPSMNGDGPPMGGDAPATGLPGDEDLASLVAEFGDDVPTDLSERADRLRDDLDAANDIEERTGLKQELIELYASSGHYGEAAVAQQNMAELTEVPEHHRRTGDLLYSWMETLEGEPVSATIAEYVVDAYRKVLDEEPDNLDVRTDMATAYLQTNQPMRGVDEINHVLEEDPEHFQARFNRGIMLSMIGRVDQAIEEFEQVQDIVGPESPYYDQADQAIETIRSQAPE